MMEYDFLHSTNLLKYLFTDEEVCMPIRLSTEDAMPAYCLLQGGGMAVKCYRKKRAFLDKTNYC